VLIHTERVFALKNVRLIFEKRSRARFISHLDMNRMMIRFIRKSKIDIWYTEGFNPHPYINFALPLPLGYEGLYEVMDIKLNCDDEDISKIPDKLNEILPRYIYFTDVFEPTLKTGEVAFSSYEITFDDGLKIKSKLEEFLKQDEIICKKRTKKGDYKDIDMSSKIEEFSVNDKENSTFLKIVLPSSPNDNISPSVLINAFLEKENLTVPFDVVRTQILDKNKNLFR